MEIHAWHRRHRRPAQETTLLRFVQANCIIKIISMCMTLQVAVIIVELMGVFNAQTQTLYPKNKSAVTIGRNQVCVNQGALAYPDHHQDRDGVALDTTKAEEYPSLVSGELASWRVVVEYEARRRRRPKKKTLPPHPRVAYLALATSARERE